ITPTSTCPWVDHVVSRLPPSTFRPVQTRFRFGSAAERLNLADDGKSPDHYAKGTPSPRGRPKTATVGLRPLVGMWFQVHYPPLIGVLPIFRSRYFVHYRSPGST